MTRDELKKLCKDFKGRCGHVLPCEACRDDFSEAIQGYINKKYVPIADVIFGGGEPGSDYVKREEVLRELEGLKVQYKCNSCGCPQGINADITALIKKLECKNKRRDEQ